MLHLIDDGLTVVTKFFANSTIVDFDSDELFRLVNDSAFADG